MSRKPPKGVTRNPVALPLAVCSAITLVCGGVAALLDLETVVDWLLIPLAFACLVLLMAYTVMAIRIGWIGSIGHLGQVFHVERRASPVGFWLLATFYLVLTAPAAWYLAKRMLVGA